MKRSQKPLDPVLVLRTGLGTCRTSLLVSHLVQEAVDLIGKFREVRQIIPAVFVNFLIVDDPVAVDEMVPQVGRLAEAIGQGSWKTAAGGWNCSAVKRKGQMVNQ